MTFGRRIAVAASALCMVICLSLSGAHADETQTFTAGGGGGTPFEVRCPMGEFLVGLEGRTGQIVDGISPICASWNAIHSSTTQPQTGTPHVLQHFGGPGGNKVARFVCPEGSALGGWWISDSRGEQPTVVGYIADQQCRSIARPTQVVPSNRVSFGSPQSKGLINYGWITCQPGQVAYGLFGGSGVFLDRVGLLCTTPQVEILKPPPFPGNTRPSPPPSPPGPRYLFATAYDDADVYNDPQGRPVATMRQGHRRQVIQQVPGWSLLYGGGDGGGDGWVACDHLSFSPPSPPGQRHLFATANDDVAVYNLQPNNNPQARPTATMRQGHTRQVIQQVPGWSLLYGGGDGGGQGWVACDHLSYVIR